MPKFSGCHLWDLANTFEKLIFYCCLTTFGNEVQDFLELLP
jgi:hypothetical protein